jgi:MFS family permease
MSVHPPASTVAQPSRLPPALRPLRHRNFALLWGASLISNIGTWMETVAVGAILARDTGKASTVGIAAAAAFLPMALFAPIGGLIGDKVHRKKFMMGTVAFDTVLALALAALIASGVRTPWILSLMLFLGGSSSALSLPNRQAMMPDLVPQQDLLGAIALGSAAWNGGRVFGPAIGGLVIAATNTTVALVINAATFAVLLGAATLLELPDRRSTGPDSSRWTTRFVQGIQAIRAESNARLAVLTVSLLACTAGPFIGLIPIVAENVFGDAGFNARLITGQGIGSVLGSLIAPSIANRIGRNATLVMALSAMPIALVAYGQAPNVWLAALALVFVGGSYFMVLNSTQTLLQLSVRPEFRARASSVSSVALGGFYVPAIAIAGLAGDRFSLRSVTMVQAALSALAVASGARPARRNPVHARRSRSP